MDLEKIAWLIVICNGIVVIGIAMVLFAIRSMHTSVSPVQSNPKNDAVPEALINNTAIATDISDGLTHEQRVVLLSCAIAAYMDGDVSGIRVKSITRLN